MYFLHINDLRYSSIVHSLIEFYSDCKDFFFFWATKRLFSFIYKWIHFLMKDIHTIYIILELNIDKWIEKGSKISLLNDIVYVYSFLSKMRLELCCLRNYSEHFRLAFKKVFKRNFCDLIFVTFKACKFMFFLKNFLVDLIETFWV